MRRALAAAAIGLMLVVGTLSPASARDRPQFQPAIGHTAISRSDGAGLVVPVRLRCSSGLHEAYITVRSPDGERILAFEEIHVTDSDAYCTGEWIDWMLPLHPAEAVRLGDRLVVEWGVIACGDLCHYKEARRRVEVGSATTPDRTDLRLYSAWFGVSDLRPAGSGGAGRVVLRYSCPASYTAGFFGAELSREVGTAVEMSRLLSDPQLTCDGSVRRLSLSEFSGAGLEGHPGEVFLSIGLGVCTPNDGCVWDAIWRQLKITAVAAPGER